MFSETPIVVQVCSPFVVSNKTRVIAPVPLLVSSTRTLKSVSRSFPKAGYRVSKASLNAASSALTGPFPLPDASTVSPSTSIDTFASVSTSTATSVSYTHLTLPTILLV